MKKNKLVSSLLVATVALLAIFALAACSSNQASQEAPAAAVDVKNSTIEPGFLTIATGQPAYSPWVSDDKPESQKGFEAALAYKIAEKLGFTADEVKWVRTGFEEAIQPGAKNFDFNLQQYTPTPERAQAVDFSTPYIKGSDGLVILESNDYSKAASIADLKGAKIAAASGSSQYETAVSLFGKENVSVYNDVDAAVQAVKVKQADVVINDLFSCYYTVDVQLSKAKLFELGTNTSDGTSDLSALLTKDSVLTVPLNDAINALWEDGTIGQLKNEWLITDYEATVLS